MLRTYDGGDIRNVALIGHLNSGKTTLAAGILYTCGKTNRLTRVDEGNTITDFDDEEIARKISISTGLAHVEWNKKKINLLDTPGFNIFTNEVKMTLAAADAALSVVDAVAGVEVQTEKTWELAGGYHLGRAFVIDKMERERANFETALTSIQEAFGKHCIPVQLPIGAEKDFVGVVDLVTMTAYTYKPDGDGKGKEGPIPATMAEAAQAAHEALVEAVAEDDDKLMAEFFETGTLPVEHIQEGLHEAVKHGHVFPVLCASGLRNIGTDRLLDFCTQYFPAPTEHEKLHAKLGDKEVERAVSDNEPASLFVFKTVADPFAGRLSYFKVMSGTVRNDAHLMDVRAGTDERLAHIAALQGRSMEPVNELHAGDIGVVPKLKEVLTGDTLADKASLIEYPPVQLPEASIAYAIHAKSRQDEDKMSQAIAKLREEDPALHFYRDPATHEFLLAGAGQQHVEIVCSKLKSRYHVDVELHAPKVPYRETIRGNADVHGRHKKQSGGHGQFGDCKIKVSPLPRGERFKFVNDIFGGAIPKQFVPAVEKGIWEAAERGYLAGYPMVDFQVNLYDGSYHDVDSNEMSFKMAGRKAFKLAMENAKPALLEPVMRVEVHAPAEYAGDLMGDFNGRRGRVQGMDQKGTAQVIKAHVPMSEMLSYQNDLTSMTQGRATFHMEFDHYDFVPGPQAEKIIAAAKSAGHGEAEEEE